MFKKNSAIFVGSLVTETLDKSYEHTSYMDMDFIFILKMQKGFGRKFEVETLNYALQLFTSNDEFKILPIMWKQTRI